MKKRRLWPDFPSLKRKVQTCFAHCPDLAYNLASSCPGATLSNEWCVRDR